MGRGAPVLVSVPSRMPSDVRAYEFFEVSVVDCRWVCRECLRGAELEELAVGKLGDPPCARCGRTSERMAAFRALCRECLLPAGSGLDPGCGTCAVRDVMSS